MVGRAGAWLVVLLLLLLLLLLRTTPSVCPRLSWKGPGNVRSAPPLPFAHTSLARTTAPRLSCKTAGANGGVSWFVRNL